MPDKVQFFETDPTVIAADLQSKYEALTNRQLQPGQAEVLVLNTMAYRLSLAMIQANEAANQCFALFATGSALDNIGVLLGVTRLPAAPSECLLRFSLVSGHGALNIPAGIKVQSIDGQAVFITTESKNVDEVTDTVDINAECTKDGKSGNGYEAGKVTVILDPLPYVATAVNLATTANGSDQETDDELRDRILLASSAFSVAGPTGAYKFYAKSAHPNIIDVAVTIGHDESGNVIPGQVDIFPLMVDGSAPDQAIMDAIYQQCNPEKRRPLNDTVVVKAPSVTEYQLEVELTLLNDAVLNDVVNKVTANLQAYRDDRKSRLGVDVIKSQIIGKSSIEKVYKVNVVQPSNDIVLKANEYAKCTGITVTVVGTSDE